MGLGSLGENLVVRRIRPLSSVVNSVRKLLAITYMLERFVLMSGRKWSD